jgi:hypothetical protein
MRERLGLGDGRLARLGKREGRALEVLLRKEGKVVRDGAAELGRALEDLKRPAKHERISLTRLEDAA